MRDLDQSEAVAALAALAQDTRLAVFRLLVQAGPTGMAAGAIAAAVGVRQNTLSTHLGILLSGGLVSKRRAGRTIFYAADFAGMRALMSYLLRDCCGADQRLCGPVLETLETVC